MTPRTLSRSIALALALLTLPLTACGTMEEAAATPALEAYPPAFRAQLTAPRRLTVSAAIAATAPRAVGGSWDGSEFSTCAGVGVTVAPAAPTLTYSIPLLPGYTEIWASPRLPLVSVRGCGAAPAAVELDYWTDTAPTPRRMPAGAFVAPPGAVLYLGVRVTGAAALTVGDLGGSLDYVR